MGLARLVGVLVFFLILTTAVNAQELKISDGGLFAIPTKYESNLTEVYFGDTLFIKVENGSGYSILVDGSNVGQDKGVYHVTKESGTITIETSPTTQTITLTVKTPEGAQYWLAKYFLFAKTACPPLTGNVTADTVIWGIFLIPVICAVVMKIVFRIVL